jgi:hypothetical protein
VDGPDVAQHGPHVFRPGRQIDVLADRPHDRAPYVVTCVTETLVT